MLKNDVTGKQETSDEKRVKNGNFWYVILIAFIVLWMFGAYYYLHTKNQLNTNPPVVVLDSTSGIDIGGFFRTNPISSKLSLTNSSLVQPMYGVRSHYDVGDIIIVKYFYVEAVVLGKNAGDSYVVLYKDHNHTLQRVSLPRIMLLSPVDGVLNPASLLVD